MNKLNMANNNINTNNNGNRLNIANNKRNLN